MFPGISRFWADFPDWSFSSFSAYEKHLQGTFPKGSATKSGPFPNKVGNPPVFHAQWNPKYGCRGTVTARFALIAFIAWKRLADSTLGKLLVHPEYG